MVKNSDQAITMYEYSNYALHYPSDIWSNLEIMSSFNHWNIASWAETFCLQ